MKKFVSKKVLAALLASACLFSTLPAGAENADTNTEEAQDQFCTIIIIMGEAYLFCW